MPVEKGTLFFASMLTSKILGDAEVFLRPDERPEDALVTSSLFFVKRRKF